MTSRLKSYHLPVLLEEAVSFLKIKPGKLYIDATAGGGGHTEEMLRQGAKVLALDVDYDALDHLNQKFKKEIRNGNLQIIKGNFANLDEIAKKYNFLPVAGVIFDLGLSSYQIENRHRGFSFESENLDMRADHDLKITALDIINNFDKRRLSELFQKFGQERNAWRIADGIVSAREIEPIKSAKQLVEIIRQAKLKGGKKINPATQVFQALRIVVNSELINLEEGLKKTINILSKNGRIVVVSYHSLEDGMIKDIFRKTKDLSVITLKPVRPSLSEVVANPKARSALLRAAEKCQQ